MTKHRCPGLEVHKVYAVVGVDSIFSVAATMDSRLPDFQELDLWPRRTCQDMTGTLEVDVLYSILELLILPWVKRDTTHQALPPALLLGTWRPKFLSRTSVQSDNTPSKVNYVPCLLIAECSPGPSNDRPSATPSAYRPGTWIFVHGDSYHLTTEEDTIPVDHCDPRSIQPSWCGLYLHSCPTLPRFSTALYSAVKSLQAK